MGHRGPKRGVLRLTALLAAVIPAAVVACSSPPPPPPQRPATSPPSKPAPPPPPVSPYTGLPTDLAAPVLGVKIDNAPEARPQSGLSVADLVYIEPVEGGISRILAIFQSNVPPEVGPVRSARESDLELLSSFGRPALGFSGEAAALRPLINRTPVLDVSANARPGLYHRGGGKAAPHNLYADPNGLRQGGAPPRDIGFRFGPAPAGGQPVPDATVQYQSARIRVSWAPAEHRWVFDMDGAPFTTASGQRNGAPTVVLQKVAVRATAIRDAAGAPSPFAETVGQGDAVVLRDGMAFNGHWARSAREAPTAFTLPDGKPLPFAPGPVWVVLVPA